MSDINVDDTDTTAIVYSGSWTQLTGGPGEEFQGTAHSTNENGASATIRFHGTHIALRCTVPEGNGSVMMNSNLDGQTGSLTRHSHDGMTYYDDPWFDRGDLEDIDHVLVISNAGGPSDSPFQLDRFIVTGSVVSLAQPLLLPASSTSTTSAARTTSSVFSTSRGPSIITSQSSANTATSSSSESSVSSTSLSSSSGSSASSITPSSSWSSTASATGGDETVVSIQYITTQADSSTQTQNVAPAGASSSSSFRNSTGMIVGSVLGGVAILLLLLLIFLCLSRRRKTGQHVKLLEDAEKRDPFRRITAVTPFRLQTSPQGGGGTPSPNSLDVGPGMTPVSSPTIINSSESATELARNVSQSTQAHSSENVYVHANEKQPHLFRDNSINSNSSNTRPDASYTSGPSPVPYTLPPLPNTDASAYRPRYLSGDTMFDAPPSNPNYLLTPLGPVDTNDFPPSYQSARNRDSYASAQIPVPPSKG